MVDLVGALKCVVDGADNVRHAIRRIQALVGIHLSGKIGVTGNLPSAQVYGLESGDHLLHRLVAGQSAEGGNVRLLLQELPQRLCSGTGQRMLDMERPAKPDHVFGGVRPGDALPTRISGPHCVQLRLIQQLPLRHCNFS